MDLLSLLRNLFIFSSPSLIWANFGPLHWAGGFLADLGFRYVPPTPPPPLHLQRHHNLSHLVPNLVKTLLEQIGVKYIPPERQDNCVDCREEAAKARLFLDKRPCCPTLVPPTNPTPPTPPAIPATPGCPRNLGAPEDKGKSGSGNFSNGDDERDHLGVVVLTPYEVYLLGQAFYFYEVDPDCYVHVCYGASCSQGLTYTIHCRDLWRLDPNYIYCATIVFSSRTMRQSEFCRAQQQACPLVAKSCQQCPRHVRQTPTRNGTRQTPSRQGTRQTPCTATRPSTDLNWCPRRIGSTFQNLRRFPSCCYHPCTRF